MDDAFESGAFSVLRVCFVLFASDAVIKDLANPFWMKSSVYRMGLSRGGPCIVWCFLFDSLINMIYMYAFLLLLCI